MWKGDWLNYMVNNARVRRCGGVQCPHLELDEKQWGYCKKRKEWVYRIKKCNRWISKVEVWR